MTGQVPYLQEMKMITSSRGQCTIDLMHNHMNFTHWLDWGGGKFEDQPQLSEGPGKNIQMITKLRLCYYC